MKSYEILQRVSVIFSNSIRLYYIIYNKYIKKDLSTSLLAATGAVGLIVVAILVLIASLINEGSTSGDL